MEIKTKNKKCELCKSAFEDNTKSQNRRFCSDICKRKKYRLDNWEKIREIEQKYSKSQKAKENRKIYSKTETAIKIKTKYNKSEKRKEYLKKYHKTEKYRQYTSNWEKEDRKKHPEKYSIRQYITKICPICLSQFSTWNSKKIYCSKKCGDKADFNNPRRKKYNEIWLKKGGREWRGNYFEDYNKRDYVKIQRKKINASPKSKELRKKYFLEHPELQKEYITKYRKSDKGLAQNRKMGRIRRGLKRSVQEIFTPLMEKAVFEAFDNKCFITGMTNEEHKQKYNKRLSLDHINPLIKKNALTFDNVCVLTQPENTKKGAKKSWDYYTPEQQQKIKELQEKAKQIYFSKYKHLENK